MYFYLTTTSLIDRRCRYKEELVSLDLIYIENLYPYTTRQLCPTQLYLEAINTIYSFEATDNSVASKTAITLSYKLI